MGDKAGNFNEAKLEGFTYAFVVTLGLFAVSTIAIENIPP